MHVWNVILLSTSPRISRHILYISVFQNIWSLTCNVKFALFKVVYCHEGIHSSFWCINFILIYFTCFLCILFANAIPLNRKIVSHCISKNNNILYFLLKFYFFSHTYINGFMVQYIEYCMAIVLKRNISKENYCSFHNISNDLQCDI